MLDENFASVYVKHGCKPQPLTDKCTHSGLMKDHGQQARASENFAGPEDFETPWPDLPVHFLNFHKLCWLWSFISPDSV